MSTTDRTSTPASHRFQRRSRGGPAVPRRARHHGRGARACPGEVPRADPARGRELREKIAKHSVADGLTIREAVIALGFVERGEVSLDELSEALDVLAMTAPLRET